MLQELKSRYGFVRYYAAVLLVLAFCVYAGHEFAHQQNHILRAKVALLEQSIENLNEDNQRINSELNVKKVELEVASISSEQLKETLRDNLSTENELRQQISFYQKVMAPEMSQDGFLIENVEISPTQSTNNFAITLMMLQHQNIKGVIKGTLKVELFGSLGGKPTSYIVNSLQDEKDKALAFSFKYFQVLETRITLPEGFTPERIEINTDVYKYKRKRGSYSKTVFWQDALE